MKLTPILTERIVTAIKLSHVPLKRIASHCNITRQTLWNWLSDGESCLEKLEDGTLQKSDLSTNQKKKLELYRRVSLARANRENEILLRIHDIAVKTENITALQWLLKLQDPAYCDGSIEDEAIAHTPIQVVAVDSDGEDKLLSEFMGESVQDDEKSCV